MFSDILQHASEVVGIQPADNNKRAQLTRIINRAAQEIYDSTDLPGSVTDNVFNIDDTQIQAITLPWFVGEIRAARYYEHGGRITIVASQARFKTYPWRPPYLQWRILGHTPLERTLNQATQLKFVIAETESDPIVISVVGQTVHAARHIENVTIAPGETEVTTTKQWLQDSPLGIVALHKDRITDHDVKAYTTVDNAQVATIYNRAMSADNTRIAITEDSVGTEIDSAVQVLYKKRYIPLYYNEDVFVDQRLEDAIIWKVREHWYSTKEGQETQAILANQKCTELVKAVVANIESRSETIITSAASPYSDAVVNYANNR